MVSNVETSVKSSTSKSVVKSIKSVFSKKSKSKSKNETSVVTKVEDEVVKESTVAENIDEAREMPEPDKSEPLDASQIEELQKVVKSTESTISKAEAEEVSSKRSIKSALSRLSLKGEEPSSVPNKSPFNSPIAEDAGEVMEKPITSPEAADEHSPTTEEEQPVIEKQEEKANDPSGREDVNESAAAVTLAVSEDIPSSNMTKSIATEEVAKPGFFCFSCQ